MSAKPQVIVSAGFDDIRARHLRFLEESSRLGELTVLLWPDAAIEKQTGRPPKFPFAERHYFLDAVRYVSRVVEADVHTALNGVPLNLGAALWTDWNDTSTAARRQFAADHGLGYRVFSDEDLAGFPEPPPMPSPPGRRKVVATGCYDWFHSGHVRFTEEAAAYGDLYVIVGHDANIRLLKGEGRPLLPEAERRYVVGSIQFVKQVLISSGEGWLDADPEIRRLKADAYVVNEDGDKGGKREYCEKMGIEYIVLKRTPAPGLPRAGTAAAQQHGPARFLKGKDQMLKTGILNPRLNSLLSRVRHTNTLVIADRGFPFWPMIETVDISLVDDVPTVLQVLEAIRGNFVVGKAWMAREFTRGNPARTRAAFESALKGVELKFEPHADFKKRVPHAVGLIRTGDTTQYANIILES
ncbi:MAG: adenylyltransferase/cytidyltransferase family protein, partial [Verrucomicrobia bacterium]|nr:adenylyltransferase/cytidyltransferase family protein [Verrucomicrobiota bacterium]